MEKENALKILRELHDKALFSERTALETFIPELKESEDEKIRKELITHCRNTRCVTEEGAERIAKWLAWLEKQGDKDNQVKLPPFTFDDILALQCCMETAKKVQEDKDLYKRLVSLHDRVHDAYHLEKQSEQKPQRMISAEAKEALYDKLDWGKEDESYLNTTIAYLKDAKEFKKTAENCIDWLKAIKQRIKKEAV